MAAAPLTPREEEVCRLVGQDVVYAEIAARLGISPHTVRTFVRSAAEKIPGDGRDQTKLIRHYYTVLLDN